MRNLTATTFHPADRRSRAVHAAERGAELADYETINLVHLLNRAAESADRARTREARLRLMYLADAAHDILMRGEAL